MPSLRGPSCGSTIAPPPASEITGTCAAPAISTTASEVGVTDEPMIRSTLSSLIRRCAFFVAVVVSVASLRIVKRIFSPPISVGHSLIACSAGMPSEAPGPVGRDDDADVDVGERGRRGGSEGERRQGEADAQPPGLRCGELVIGSPCGHAASSPPPAAVVGRVPEVEGLSRAPVLRLAGPGLPGDRHVRSQLLVRDRLGSRGARRTASSARTVLGEAILLYRTAGGEIVALRDRCCHRLAPLSMGRKEGDCVRCGYHGLLFDATGRCIEIPGSDTVPAKARVQRYPLAVKNKWVFVWMGDPAQADPALLPDNFSCDSPEWDYLPGYLHYDDAARS